MCKKYCALPVLTNDGLVWAKTELVPLTMTAALNYSFFQNPLKALIHHLVQAKIQNLDSFIDKEALQVQRSQISNLVCYDIKMKSVTFLLRRMAEYLSMIQVRHKKD